MYIYFALPKLENYIKFHLFLFRFKLLHVLSCAKKFLISRLKKNQTFTNS